MASRSFSLVRLARKFSSRRGASAASATDKPSMRLAAPPPPWSFLTPRTSRRTPSLGALVEWVTATESALASGLAQTREITRRQVELRERQIERLRALHPAPTPPLVQARLDSLATQRAAWTSFEAAHTTFLTSGIGAARRAVREPLARFLARAFVHVCTGIVYLKNVFIFTWSMRGAGRAQLLKQCRTCMTEGASFLDQLAPTLTAQLVREHAMLYWALRASAFHLVVQLMQARPDAATKGRAAGESAVAQWDPPDMNQLADPSDLYAGELHRLASIPAHLIDYRVMLDLIPLGLDPTLTVPLSKQQFDITHDTSLPDQKQVKIPLALSAIQHARMHVEQWKREQEGATTITTTATEGVTRAGVTVRGDAQSGTAANSPARRLSSSYSLPRIPNILRTFIQWPPIRGDVDLYLASSIEDRRRKQLHLDFVRRLADVWHRHSMHIRRLLTHASPNTLIPDLVNIVAEYLDLDQPDNGDAEEKMTPPNVQMQ